MTTPVLLDVDPVVTAIVEFMKRSRHAYWLGDCCTLRRALVGLGGEDLPPEGDQFEQSLRGLIPALLAADIEATIFDFPLSRPCLLRRTVGEDVTLSKRNLEARLRAQAMAKARAKAKPRRKRRKRGVTCP